MRLVGDELVLIENALGFDLLRRNHGGVRLGRRHAGIRGVDRCVGLQQLGPCRIDRLLRPDRLAGKSNGAVVFELGVGGGGLGGGKLGFRLGDLRPPRGDLLIEAGDRGLLCGDLRLGLLQGDAIVGIVDQKERRSRRHAGVVADRHGLDVAGDLRRDHGGVRGHIGIVG